MRSALIFAKLTSPNRPTHSSPSESAKVVVRGEHAIRQNLLHRLSVLGGSVLQENLGRLDSAAESAGGAVRALASDIFVRGAVVPHAELVVLAQAIVSAIRLDRVGVALVVEVGDVRSARVQLLGDRGSQARSADGDDAQVASDNGVFDLTDL